MKAVEDFDLPVPSHNVPLMVIEELEKCMEKGDEPTNHAQALFESIETLDSIEKNRLAEYYPRIFPLCHRMAARVTGSISFFYTYFSSHPAQQNCSWFTISRQESGQLFAFC